MKIEHDRERCEFKAFTDDGVRIGEIAYEECDGNLTATHTLVADAFQGKGAAQELLDALRDYAAENGMKIIPVCSYVVAAFKRYPERYKAVIGADGTRSR